MASREVLDFDRLLQPISTDSPCGSDLRAVASPLYHSIKHTRIKARKAEGTFPDKDQKQDDYFFYRESVPDWRTIDQEARIVLGDKSKDLEVTACLIESLVRLYGFAGLRDGFRLALELVERYWDGLFPLPDQHDEVPRVWPLAGLIGQYPGGILELAIGRVPLTEPSERIGSESICYQDYRIYQEQPDSPATAKIKALIGKAKEKISPDSANELREDIKQCRKYFARLCELINEKCQADVVSDQYIDGVLTNCLEALRQLSPTIDQPDTLPSIEGGPQPDRQSRPGPDLTSRENALHALLEVAEYFEHREPHSPVSYQLKQVVRWARMSLPELLGELITDEKARSEYCKLAGIRPQT